MYLLIEEVYDNVILINEIEKTLNENLDAKIYNHYFLFSQLNFFYI